MVSLKVHPSIQSSSLALLELNDELRGCLESGQELLIKGTSAEDELILCTPSRTFSIRQMTSSNLSLLVEGTTGQVVTMTSHLLEAVKCPPRLGRLYDWLASTSYEGPDELDSTTSVSSPLLEALRADRLLGEIQASHEEIRRALTEQAAVLIDGHYRCLGADLTCRLFKSLFAGLTLRDQHATGTFSKKELMSCLVCGGDEGEIDLVPLPILEHFLSIYTKMAQQEDGDGNVRGPDREKRCFDETRVCRFFAQELLRARAVWNLSELMRAWQQLTGDLTPDPHRMLVGLALLEAIPGREDELRVMHFPAARLPMEPVALFEALFERRSRWEYDTIEPYVEAAARSLDLSAADLIVRHGRISVDPVSQRRIVTPLVAPMS